MQIHEKLVRDKIPAIIEANGEKPNCRTLTPDQFERALRIKLVEEGHELIEANTPQEILRESADLLEVLCTFWEFRGMSLKDVQKERKRIRAKRGGFDNRVFLKSVG